MQQIKTLYSSTFNLKNISKNTYSARRLPDKIHHRIVKCIRCSLVFSSPIISSQKIFKFYKESLCNYGDQIPYLIKTYFKLVNDIKKSLPKNPKVLEVGCGNGFFIKALIDKHFTKNVFGVEPSKTIISQADSFIKNKIKLNIFKPNLFQKNSFDLICCFHTLDHMIDPNQFIRGARAILRKNGYIIIVVHDTEGLSVKLFGEKSAIFDIEHIYLFNKKTLRKIFVRNSFKVIKVFNLVNSYPLNYWIQMSGFPHIVKKYTKFVFNILKIGKVAVSIPAGNIVLIARNV